MYGSNLIHNIGEKDPYAMYGYELKHFNLNFSVFQSFLGRFIFSFQRFLCAGFRGGRVWRKCRVSRQQGIPLILAYSWARLAIFAAGKGKGECFYFFCFFPFIPVPFSPLFFSFISCTISSISFLPLSGRRHKIIDPQGLMCR